MTYIKLSFHRICLYSSCFAFLLSGHIRVYILVHGSRFCVLLLGVNIVLWYPAYGVSVWPLLCFVEQDGWEQEDNYTTASPDPGFA